MTTHKYSVELTREDGTELIVGVNVDKHRGGGIDVYVTGGFTVDFLAPVALSVREREKAERLARAKADADYHESRQGEDRS